MRIMRWGWIVLAGVVAEGVSIAFLVGLRYWQGGSARAELSALGNAMFEVELFAVTALFGWWAARKTISWPLLDGALVGVVTIVIYEILAYGQPVPHNAEYFFLHGMKLVAGAVGGWIAGWQAPARTRAPVS
jgi:hypothetical protein